MLARQIPQLLRHRQTELASLIEVCGKETYLKQGVRVVVTKVPIDTVYTKVVVAGFVDLKIRYLVPGFTI